MIKSKQIFNVIRSFKHNRHKYFSKQTNSNLINSKESSIKDDLGSINNPIDLSLNDSPKKDKKFPYVFLPQNNLNQNNCYVTTSFDGRFEETLFNNIPEIISIKKNNEIIKLIKQKEQKFFNKHKILYKKFKTKMKKFENQEKNLKEKNYKNFHFSYNENETKKIIRKPHKFTSNNSIIVKLPVKKTLDDELKNEFINSFENKIYKILSLLLEYEDIKLNKEIDEIFGGKNVMISLINDYKSNFINKKNNIFNYLQLYKQKENDLLFTSNEYYLNQKRKNENKFNSLQISHLFDENYILNEKNNNNNLQKENKNKKEDLNINNLNKNHLEKNFEIKKEEKNKIIESNETNNVPITQIPNNNEEINKDLNQKNKKENKGIINKTRNKKIKKIKNNNKNNSNINNNPLTNKNNNANSKKPNIKSPIKINNLNILEVNEVPASINSSFTLKKTFGEEIYDLFNTFKIINDEEKEDNFFNYLTKEIIKIRFQKKLNDELFLEIINNIKDKISILWDKEELEFFNSQWVFYKRDIISFFDRNDFLKQLGKGILIEIVRNKYFFLKRCCLKLFKINSSLNSKNIPIFKELKFNIKNKNYTYSKITIFNTIYSPLINLLYNNLIKTFMPRRLKNIFFHETNMMQQLKNNILDIIENNKFYLINLPENIIVMNIYNGDFFINKSIYEEIKTNENIYKKICLLAKLNLCLLIEFSVVVFKIIESINQNYLEINDNIRNHFNTILFQRPKMDTLNFEEALFFLDCNTYEDKSLKKYTINFKKYIENNHNNSNIYSILFEKEYENENIIKEIVFDYDNIDLKNFEKNFIGLYDEKKIS